MLIRYLKMFTMSAIGLLVTARGKQTESQVKVLTVSDDAFHNKILFTFDGVNQALVSDLFNSKEQFKTKALSCKNFEILDEEYKGGKEREVSKISLIYNSRPTSDDYEISASSLCTFFKINAQENFTLSNQTKNGLACLEEMPCDDGRWSIMLLIIMPGVMTPMACVAAYNLFRYLKPKPQEHQPDEEPMLLDARINIESIP